MKMSLDKYINQIIEGNCVEVMKKFDDEVIDLTVTSPPYDNFVNFDKFFQCFFMAHSHNFFSFLCQES